MTTAVLGMTLFLGPADAGTRHAPVGTASPASVARFELTGEDGLRPLHWNACSGIDYRIDRRSMPAGVRPVIERSMRIISRQTGVHFRDAGETRRRFDDTAPPSTPTIFFSFTSERHAFGETLAWPGEVGVGGPIPAHRGPWGSGPAAIVGGRVLLSTAFTGPLLGPGATWQSLITHEVGHALNLAHQDEVGEVMNPALTAESPGRLQADEVAALDQVLTRTGCSPRASPKR